MWVLEGDEVVAVNGESVEGKSLDEARRERARFYDKADRVCSLTRCSWNFCSKRLDLSSRTPKARMILSSAGEKKLLWRFKAFKVLQKVVPARGLVKVQLHACPVLASWR